MTKQEFVRKLLQGAGEAVKESGMAFAPSNIALSKYWGKRDAELNLPLSSSLSVSLGELGTRTGVKFAEKDSVCLNGEMQDSGSVFVQRLSEFLDLFRSEPGQGFEVCTSNNIPTAAGLASSASGFAALVLALNELFGWNLSRRKLSMLARLGSGSAARSVYDGFVLWHAGVAADGSDSFAERLDPVWPEFRIGILELCSAEKPVGSRAGMSRTVETSTLFGKWPEKSVHDTTLIRRAIEEKDFELLGATAESNALAMHATMIDSWPPLLYWQPESVAMMHRVWALRAEGLQLFFTMDAGPNLKLLFTAEHEAEVYEAFPAMQVPMRR